MQVYCPGYMEFLGVGIDSKTAGNRLDDTDNNFITRRDAAKNKRETWRPR